MRFIWPPGLNAHPSSEAEAKGLSKPGTEVTFRQMEPDDGIEPSSPLYKGGVLPIERNGLLGLIFCYAYNITTKIGASRAY